MALDDDTARSSGSTKAAGDFLPRTTSAYGDPRYWDARFAVEEHYEWLKEYSHFRHLIRPYISQTHSLLELGCGNSRLSEGLYADGLTDITCIDLSAIAVRRMRKRLKELGLRGIRVIEADMLDLPFESESFDIVIEKGAMAIKEWRKLYELNKRRSKLFPRDVQTRWNSTYKFFAHSY